MWLTIGGVSSVIVGQSISTVKSTPRVKNVGVNVGRNGLEDQLTDASAVHVQYTSEQIVGETETRIDDSNIFLHGFLVISGQNEWNAVFLVMLPPSSLVEKGLSNFMSDKIIELSFGFRRIEGMHHVSLLLKKHHVDQGRNQG